MKDLPVYQKRGDIIAALKDNQVIIVESPTGSGKTTQIPLILNEAGYTKNGIVGVTQPRRVATLSVTDFIDKQLGYEKGFVGYKMRFSDTTEANTRIKVMTDGILLMELKADPLLSRYSVILVDEAHERSLNIDFVLGLLKNILEVRKDFKVIVSSATINTKVFSTFFLNAPIISIKARVHPVEIFYKPLKNRDDSDELFSTIVSIVESRTNENSGDILIFLPGEFDIKMCLQALSQSKVSKKLKVLPLYGRLSKEEQELVFVPTPEGKTKVVVATNIAETSITIDKVTTVIDSGVAKINYYNQKNFTSSLITLPISRSSCKQRSGRAGRTAAGVCYRLYAKEDYTQRELYSLEEIMRTDLSEVVLRMSELGIYDYEKFPFITRPNQGAIKSAEETLVFIDAINNKRELTQIGQYMVRFPLLPRHSRVLVEAMLRHFSVIEEVIIAVAFLSTKTPFLFPPMEEDAARNAHQKFNDELGDFISYLNIYRFFKKLKTNKERQNWCKNSYLDYESMVEIDHVVDQLSQIVSDFGFPIASGGSTKEYLLCLSAGLMQYVCIKAERNIYRSLTADKIYLHPGSAWFKQLPQFILAGEIVQTSRLYARTVSPLQRDWLDQIDPNLRKRLFDLVSTKRKEERGDKKERVRAKEAAKSSDSIQIFGRHYPLVGSKKGNKKIAVIPIEELSFLANAFYSSRKKTKNIFATLKYKDYYIHFRDKLYSVIDLNGKLKPEKGILENPPKGNFSLGEIDLLVDNLDWILAFCKLKKRKRELGFVQLNFHGKGIYRFSSTANGFEALDNSLFALGQLIDDLSGDYQKKQLQTVKKMYEKLLKIFDY